MSNSLHTNAGRDDVGVIGLIYTDIHSDEPKGRAPAPSFSSSLQGGKK